MHCARVQFALVSTRLSLHWCTEQFTLVIGEHRIKFAQVHTRAIVEMAEAAAALHLPCQINHVQPTSDDEDDRDDHSLCLCSS